MTKRTSLLAIFPIPLIIVLAVAGAIAADLRGNSETPVTSEEIAAGEACLDIDTIVENTPSGPMLEYLGADSMATLVEKSPIVARGRVVAEEGPIETDFPVRAPPSYIVSTFQVTEVLKGDIQEAQITFGHFWNNSHPAVPVGCEALLFLKRVDSPHGNDYTIINGPQGKFILALDRVSPMSQARFGMSAQYRDMSGEQFLQEVRESIALTSGQ